MKQIYLTLLLAVISLFTSQTTSAYDFEVDGVYYNYKSSGEYAIVAGCNYALKSIIIPSTITYNGKIINVREIAWGASFGNKDTLVIGNRIRTIEPESFSGEHIKFLKFEDSSLPLNMESVTVGWGISSRNYNPFSGTVIERLYLGRNIKDNSSHSWKFNNLRTLIIGKDVSELPFLDLNRSECKPDTIVSLIEDPTIISTHFNNETYKTSQLLVPTGTLDIYKKAYGWRNFQNIQEIELVTDIISVLSTKEKVETNRYNTSGQLVKTPQKGINIIKYSDGTTKKVIIK